MNLDIRPMSRADLDAALGWARDEGWNPGLDDSAPFHAQDPSGFLIGWIGTVRIGCISVVKCGADFAFLKAAQLHRGKPGRASVDLPGPIPAPIPHNR